MEEYLLKGKKRRLNKAKLHLYHAFIEMPHEELSDNEVDIMYLLSKEKDIQDAFLRSGKES